MPIASSPITQHNHPPSQQTGFLPVIFTLVNSRRKRAHPPVHLPTDADAQEDLIAAPRLTSTFTDELPDTEQLAVPKALGEAKPMRGWAYLLLWLPAACDLTGTTVSFSSWLALVGRDTCAYLYYTPRLGRHRSAIDAGGPPSAVEARGVSFAERSSALKALLDPSLLALLSFPWRL